MRGVYEEMPIVLGLEGILDLYLALEVGHRFIKGVVVLYPYLL